MSKQDLLIYLFIAAIAIGVRLGDFYALPTSECRRSAEIARQADYSRIIKFPPFVPERSVAEEMRLADADYENRASRCKLTASLTD